MIKHMCKTHYDMPAWYLFNVLEKFFISVRHAPVKLQSVTAVVILKRKEKRRKQYEDVNSASFRFK